MVLAGSQSFGSTRPPLNSKIRSITSQLGISTRLRYRLMLARFRPTAVATSASVSLRASMKAERCMTRNVRDTHISSQAICARGVVARKGAPVHDLYMPPRKQKPKKPKFSHHFLKEWRDKRNLSQEALGERIGRSHATVQRIETQQVALTQPVLDQLARALRTTRGKILDEPPSELD